LTIREVAAAAGVSTQTVSRVLNNRPDVAPETLNASRGHPRDRLRPEHAGPGLTQGRSHVLGVVAYGLDYFGPSRVLTAIERQAAEIGYAIMLNLILEPETTMSTTICSAPVAPARWTASSGRSRKWASNRAWLRTKGVDLLVPVILVGGMAGRPTCRRSPSTTTAIGCLATEHLLAGGAARVGIITGPLNWWEAQQRLAGWRQTIRGPRPGGRRSSSSRATGRCRAASRALYRLLEPARTSTPSLPATTRWPSASSTRRIAWPARAGELSVVGVDNIAEASHFWPPLTTVHQPLGDAGASRWNGGEERSTS
jgi:LacI family transcriptional regulator